MMTRRALPLVLPLLLVAACSFLKKSQPRIFPIDKIAATTPAATVTGTRGTPFAIEGLELPPGIDRREIVVRRADRQLDVRESDLWAAQLQPLMLHTLAVDLASRLPEGMLILPGELRPAAVRSIDVVVEDLAVGPDPHIVLDAHWVEGNVSHREHVAIDVPSLESPNVSTGMSQVIAALADRIASQLR